MKKNAQNFCVQSLLFGMIKLDESTPSSIKGIIFDSATDSDFGLILIHDQKILFIHANTHLSAKNVVDGLLPHRQWLGENYDFYVIIPTLKNSESRLNKEKEFDSFIQLVSMHLAQENFKCREFKRYIQNNQRITISRQGAVSDKKFLADFEQVSNIEIRRAINCLNCFTGIEKNNEFGHSNINTLMFMKAMTAIVQNPMNSSYLCLDLLYNRTQWTELPQLNKLSALVIRFFRNCPFRENLIHFFNALGEFLSEDMSEMEMRIILSLRSKDQKVGGIFSLNEIHENLKVICSYYDSLLKKATGFLTQEAVKAYKQKDYISSEKFAREAINIIMISGSAEEMAVAYYNLGTSLMEQKKYQEAITELTFSKKSYQQLSNIEKVEKCNKKLKNCQDMIDLETFNKCHQMYPIHEAVKNNDLNLVKSLFEKDSNVFLIKEHYGWTALTYAIFFRVSLDIVKFIIEKSPETAKETYYSQYAEKDVWGFDLNVFDCDMKYSLLRFSLYIPEKFSSLIFSWDERTQIEIINLLLNVVPNIHCLQKSEESDEEDCNDLNYALSKKVPLSIIQLLIEKVPTMVEKTESLVTAILSGTDDRAIQKLIEIDIEGVEGISHKHHITPIFAAVYSNTSLYTINLLLKKSPLAATQLIGSRFLSGWSGFDSNDDDDDSVEYISVPNTTILMLALKNKRFNIANLLLDKMPTLAFLADEEEKPMKTLDRLLMTTNLPNKEKKEILALQNKINFYQQLQKLTVEEIHRIVRFQAITRGYISRKNSNLLKSEYVTIIKQRANKLILELVSAGRYFEISKITELLHKELFFSALHYIKQLKWLDNFSDDVICKILKFLNGVDLIQLSQTSKRYYLLLKDELIWKEKIKQEFTETPIIISVKNYAEQYKNMLFGKDILNSISYQIEYSYYTYLKGKSRRWLRPELDRFLNYAIRIRAEKWVLTLLQAGAIPTLFLFKNAMRLGAKNCAKLLIQYGLNINSKNNDNILNNQPTLFHMTLNHIDSEMLEFLFDQPGINVLPQLHQMAARGNLQGLSELLNEEDVNQKDLGNYTPIFWATVMGQTIILKELINRGARLQHNSNILIDVLGIDESIIINGRYSLIILALFYRKFELAMVLVERIIDKSQLSDVEVNVLEGPTISLLQLVAEIGDLEGIKLLLSFSNSLPTHNPLAFAAKKGHSVCVEYLIQRGFSVNECIHLNHQNGDGELVRTSDTPLGVAAEGGHLECIELLLKAGANANQSYQQYYPQKRQESPLLSFNGVPLHKLMKHIANPGVFEKNELSSSDFDLSSFTKIPLISRAIKALHLLIKATQNIDCIETSANQTPLTSLVCSVHSVEWIAKDKVKNKNYNRLIIYCMQVCLEADADINHRCGYFKGTVLHEAVRQERVELLEFLLQRGMNVEEKNDLKETPLMLAKDQSCREKLKTALLLKEKDVRVTIETHQLGSGTNNVLLFSNAITPLGVNTAKTSTTSELELTTSNQNNRKNKKKVRGKQ